MDLCLPFPTWSFQIIAKQILNFPFLWYNDNPLRKRVRDGEFPLLVTQGTSQFPTYGLAVVVKKEFLPLEASLCYASRGRNSFSTTPAKPCVGNWDVPFVTRRGIHFLPLVASPLVVGNIPSLTLFLKGLGHLHTQNLGSDNWLLVHRLNLWKVLALEDSFDIVFPPRFCTV